MLPMAEDDTVDLVAGLEVVAIEAMLEEDGADGADNIDLWTTQEAMGMADPKVCSISVPAGGGAAWDAGCARARNDPEAGGVHGLAVA